MRIYKTICKLFLFCYYSLSNFVVHDKNGFLVRWCLDTRCVSVFARFAFSFFFFFLFFWVFMRFRECGYCSCIVSWTVTANVDFSTVNSASVYCSRIHKFHISATFSLKMGPTALFTHLKIILLQCFQFSVSAK